MIITGSQRGVLVHLDQDQVFAGIERYRVDFLVLGACSVFVNVLDMPVIDPGLLGVVGADADFDIHFLLALHPAGAVRQDLVLLIFELEVRDAEEVDQGVPAGVGFPIQKFVFRHGLTRLVRNRQTCPEVP
jgi:hypothetical protein